MIQDIHDIRPPVMTGMDPALVKILLIGAAAVAVLGLVALGIWFWRKKRKGQAKSDLPQLPLLSPYETALRNLEVCLANHGGDAKAFYFELGRIMKAYISGTFGINCLEMTTEEMARSVKGLKGLNPGLKSDLIRFQDQCDPIRYMPREALENPDGQQLQKDLVCAGKLVDEMQAATAPKDEETKAKTELKTDRQKGEDA